MTKKIKEYIVGYEDCPKCNNKLSIDIYAKKSLEDDTILFSRAVCRDCHTEFDMKIRKHKPSWEYEREVYFVEKKQRRIKNEYVKNNR